MAAERCPRCGSERGVPVRYGLPTRDMFDRSERGEIVLGGCLVFSDSPGFACAACGHEFGTAEPGSFTGIIGIVAGSDAADGLGI